MMFLISFILWASQSTVVKPTNAALFHTIVDIFLPYSMKKLFALYFTQNYADQAVNLRKRMPNHFSVDL